MKYIVLVGVCLLISGAGYREIVCQHRKTARIDQAVRLLGFIRTQINYRRSDCEDLYRYALESGFDCLLFDDGRLFPGEEFPEKVEAELVAFFTALGTTDTDGQLLLCDEYYERVKVLYEEQRGEEKSKVQVRFAVSLLCVFSIIVLFL